MTHISNKTIILSKTSVRSGKGNGFGDECYGDDMEDYEDQFFEDQPYEEEYYEEYYDEFYEQEQKIEEHIERATEIEMIDEEEEEVVVPKTKAPKPVVEEMDSEYKKYLALLNTRAVESKKLEDKMLHEVYCWADSMQVPVTDFGVTLEEQYENVQFEQKAALKKAADKFEEEEKIRVAKEAQEQVDAMIEFEENKANEVAKNKKNGWRKAKIAEKVAAKNKVLLEQLRAKQLFASQKLKYEIALKQAVKKGKCQEIKDLNIKLETLESTFKPAGKRLGRKMGKIVKQVEKNILCENNKIVTSHQISVEEDFDSDCEEEEEPMKLVLPEFSNFIVEEDKKHIQTVAMNDKITKSLKKTAIKNKLREEDDKTWTKVQLKKVSAECNQVGRAEKAKKIVEKKEQSVETKKCTRMCSSVSAKIECPHGHRCRFAHTVSELVKQFCAFDCDCILVRINKQGDLINVPSKKTGKVCSFWHTDETEEMYAKRFGYRSEVPQQVVPQVFVEEVVSVPQVQKPVDNRVDYWPEVKEASKNAWKVSVVKTKTLKQIQESQASVILEKPVVAEKEVETSNGYKHYYNANFKTGQTVEYVPSKGPITIRIPKAHAEFAYFKAIEQGYFDIQLIITD